MALDHWALPGPGPVFADIDDSFQGLAPAAGLSGLGRAQHQEERTFKVDSQLCAPLWHERKKFHFVLFTEFMAIGIFLIETYKICSLHHLYIL